MGDFHVMGEEFKREDLHALDVGTLSQAARRAATMSKKNRMRKTIQRDMDFSRTGRT
jgi:hypothetical protein